MNPPQQPPRPLGPPTRPVAAPPAPGHSPKIAAMPMTGHRPTDEELAPLALLGDDNEAAPTAQAAPSKIKAFGIRGGPAQHEPFQRKTDVTGHGACRVRTFHGRLSDEGMAYLDDKINDWLDHHPEIEVKFVTSTVGVFEGKIREPALVLNVWY